MQQKGGAGGGSLGSEGPFRSVVGLKRRVLLRSPMTRFKGEEESLIRSTWEKVESCHSIHREERLRTNPQRKARVPSSGSKINKPGRKKSVQVYRPLILGKDQPNRDARESGKRN